MALITDKRSSTSMSSNLLSLSTCLWTSTEYHAVNLFLKIVCWTIYNQVKWLKEGCHICWNGDNFDLISTTAKMKYAEDVEDDDDEEDVDEYYSINVKRAIRWFRKMLRALSPGSERNPLKIKIAFIWRFQPAVNFGPG